MGSLAKAMGGLRGEDSVTAMQDVVEAMNLLRGAARKDARLAPIVQAMLAVVTQGGGAGVPAGPPGAAMAGPIPPGAMAQGGPPGRPGML